MSVQLSTHHGSWSPHESQELQINRRRTNRSPRAGIAILLATVALACAIQPESAVRLPADTHVFGLSESCSPFGSLSGCVRMTTAR